MPNIRIGLILRKHGGLNIKSTSSRDFNWIWKINVFLELEMFAYKETWLFFLFFFLSGLILLLYFIPNWYWYRLILKVSLLVLEHEKIRNMVLGFSNNSPPSLFYSSHPYWHHQGLFGQVSENKLNCTTLYYKANLMHHHLMCCDGIAFALFSFASHVMACFCVRSPENVSLV